MIPCEAIRRLGPCPDDAAGLRSHNGLPYSLCGYHRTMPLSNLRLTPPLDWEGVQSMYHRIWRA